jgi:Domain of unknown function (DUF5107)
MRWNTLLFLALLAMCLGTLSLPAQIAAVPYLDKGGDYLGATPGSGPWLTPVQSSPLTPPRVGPTVRETSIIVSTYNYQQALVATTSDDPVYPYPRMKHEWVGPPSPRPYKALVLENQYVQLTILPELGGRIYRWIDKASGHNLFYQNPVIKPTTWGQRGWWLATGGMEWALPLDEHGLSEASPWTYTLQQDADTASVAVSDHEERSGLLCTVTISLDAEHSYFTLEPAITNPTTATVPFKFWLNGMFGLGAQQVGAGIEFTLPVTQVVVHSTGDDALPGEKTVMDWPVYDGRDLSDYGTWTRYLGVFAYPAAQSDFMGAYNHDTGLGVVRIFPHQVVRGAKIFAPGDIDPARWTDDKSSYFELWGGLAADFWDEVSLAPHQSLAWQERWYAVNNTDGFGFANETVALNLTIAMSTVEVAAASTAATSGRLVLYRDGSRAAAWEVALSPLHTFRGSLQPPEGDVSGQWRVVLFDTRGEPVAEDLITGPAVIAAQ